jgi:hypothetical protein
LPPLTIVGTAATIVGVMVAAWWAYTRYVAEDAPTLALRPKMQGELSCYGRAGSDTECIAVFKITLRIFQHQVHCDDQAVAKADQSP